MNLHLELINRTQSKVPDSRAMQTHLRDWVKTVARHLRKSNHWNASGKTSLTVVFVTPAAMIQLNSQYRGKNSVTDILSFDSLDPQSMGELVICLAQIKTQAKTHSLSLKQELSYMVLHGILHLLGFDHEGSQIKARKMFAIQDQIFRLYLE